jgi:hypothetical protein
VAVGGVWNVGPKYSAMLERNGIKTALDNMRTARA